MNVLLAFIPGYLALLTSIVVGVFFYKRLNPCFLKFFVWFLVITLLVQLSAQAYSQVTKKSNHFIFNCYIFIQFIFYLFVFYKTFEKRKLKLLTMVMAAMFVVFYLYQTVFEIGIFTFVAESNTLGSILVIVCCLLYFVSLFQAEEVVNYFRIPMFWIATGLLFYFVGNFLYLGLVNYIVQHRLDSSGNIYLYFIVVLNLILYGLFTAALLSNQLWKNGT